VQYNAYLQKKHYTVINMALNITKQQILKTQVMMS